MRALGTWLIAIQDPSLAAGANAADILSLILQADWLVKSVLATLLLFSAGSWGIIAYKMRHLRRAKAQNSVFLDTFRRSSRFSEVQAACASLPASPLVGLFQSGYAELTAQMRGAGENRPADERVRPTLRSLEAVDRALLRASTTEIAKLEHRIAFLATTA